LIVVGLVAFVITWVVVAAAGIAIGMRTRELARGEDLPSRFPVVVMLRGASDAEATCRLMFHEAVVAASAEELHSFAYVIPDEARERCGKQLGLQREFSGGRVEWRLPVWQQSTRFSPVSEQGTQDIEVSAT
jgi:hypothetical protein